MIVVQFFWQEEAYFQYWLNSWQNFEQTLKESKEMWGGTTNDPELLVPPPVMYTDTSPLHFQDASCSYRDEEGHENDTGIVTYLWRKEKKKH